MVLTVPCGVEGGGEGKTKNELSEVYTVSRVWALWGIVGESWHAGISEREERVDIFGCGRCEALELRRAVIVGCK